MHKKNYIQGMRIDSIDRNDFINRLNEIISGNDQLPKHISITNTEAMYFGMSDEKHREYINDSEFSLCDGIGVKLAAFFNGMKIIRYHGPDMMLDVLKFGQEFGWTHYFLGGQRGVAEKLKEIIINKYPKTKILGMYSPPFRDLTKEEEMAMLKELNSLKPDFLWVSLGLPKQEIWIRKYKNKLHSKFLIGVGAAFDFHTENVKRAPKFFQTIGFEWLYRMMYEPRLFVRNVRASKFFIRAILK